MVDEEEIEHVQPVSLTDATERIPGVEKTSDSAVGGRISNIRGLGRNNVIFLVDGCRVNTATDINARFGLINPDDIERIRSTQGAGQRPIRLGFHGRCSERDYPQGRTIPTPLGKVAGSRSAGPATRKVQGFMPQVPAKVPRGWLTAAGGYRDYDDRDGADHDTIPNSGFRDDYAKLAGGFRWNDANETTVNLQQMEGHGVGIPGKGLSLPEGPDATYPRTSRVLYALTHTVAPDAGRLTESKIDFIPAGDSTPGAPGQFPRNDAPRTPRAGCGPSHPGPEVGPTGSTWAPTNRPWASTCGSGRWTAPSVPDLLKAV